MSQDDADHSHCDTCIKTSKCRYKNLRETKCPIIACVQSCGFEFHRCKSMDHQLICMNEKVKCINHNFGCPVHLLRHQIAKHISCCPSSVIHCYVEWNRWPIYTRDRKLTQPIVSHTLDTQHLDVALTLRDQRMLEELWTATRKTRCALRNSLTRKYPAVPLKPYCGTHVDNVSTDNQGTYSPTSPSASSIITPQTVSDDDSDSSPWQMHRAPPGLQRSVCARLNGLPHRSGSKNSPVLTSSPTPTAQAAVVSCHFKCANNHNSDATANVDRSSSQLSDIPVPPLLPNCTSLSLDLNLNSFAPFQAKPKLMYTFRCAQEFRRDEYGSHYKNFHGDILGSLNGWMEHRCPLWQYGCNYVQRRIHPLPRGTKIIFNPIVESFGHVIDSNSPFLKPDSNIFPLPNLPNEILRQICSYLDGFSLNNLSMTCHKLRDTCCSLLENRGIVVLQWERRSSPEAKHRWVVGNKKWAFTSYFTEIEGWYLDEKHDILNHIHSCPHYECIRRTEPFTYGVPGLKVAEENKKEL